MDGWRQDMYERARACKSIKSAHALLSRYCCEWGYDYFSYGHRAALVNGSLKMRYNNYPHRWNQLYREENLVAVDPTVQSALLRSTPIVWPDSLKGLNEKTEKFWLAAWDSGLRNGIGFAVHSRENGIGLLSFSKQGREITSQDLDRYESRMRWLAEAMNSCYETNENLNNTYQKLTKREREALLWTAVGKSANDVANILNITERTANFHLANAMAKLNAVNKTQAAVKAMSLNIIEP